MVTRKDFTEASPPLLRKHLVEENPSRKGLSENNAIAKSSTAIPGDHSDFLPQKPGSARVLQNVCICNGLLKS